MCIFWEEQVDLGQGREAPVTDGSYMKELYPYLNSAAFVLECSKGRGRLTGSFVKQTPNAGSYQGEILGHMAIHLLLRGINEALQGQQGAVHNSWTAWGPWIR